MTRIEMATIAFTAIQTIIAYLVFRNSQDTRAQQQQISELATIASEMEKQTKQLVRQNEILIGQHNLEMKLSLKQRIAFFQKYLELVKHPVSGFKISLVNIGITASNLGLEFNRHPEETTITLHYDRVESRNLLHINIIFKNPGPDTQFDFDISFSNPEGQRTKQRIYGRTIEDYIVGAPEDPLTLTIAS